MTNATQNNDVVFTDNNGNQLVGECFSVCQCIYRNDAFRNETIASFGSMKEAASFAKRCHNGNPTTTIKHQNSGKVFTAHKDTNGTTLIWQSGPIFADRIV